MPPKKAAGAAKGKRGKAGAAAAAPKKAKKTVVMPPPTADELKRAAEGDAYSVTDAGLRRADSEAAGIPLFFGSTFWDIPSNKKGPPDSELLSAHKIVGIGGARIRRAAAGPGSTSFVLVAMSGAVFVFGRNDQGQLGLGMDSDVDKPTLVTSLLDTKIIDAAVGRRFTLLLTSEGKVLACGDNRCGQLGLGHQNSVSTFKEVNMPKAIKRIACGGDFSMFLDVDGDVYSCGHPDYGQLGHGTDGKYFISASKLSYHWELTPRKIEQYLEKDKNNHAAIVENVKIQDIACGINHTIALDTEGRLFSWGFGGYGRLGHNSAQDEKHPRLLALFALPHHRAASIAAGGTCSLALSAHKQLYFWGQIKSSGEANIYPKPVHDLGGYNVTALSAGNKHIVLSAEGDMVTWGPSPCYGELGLGASSKSKSSTKPQIVKALEGIKAISSAAGFASTILIAEGSPTVAALPTFGSE